MDESAFRRARDVMAPRPCAFERALLAGACACSLAARRNIAEREAVACGLLPAREECAALCALLRRNSAFALKLTQIDAPLPHAKEMKLQCGGLQGVQRALSLAAAVDSPARESPPAVQGLVSVADVRGLVEAARQKFGDLQNLPYSAIVQSVAAYQIRRRRTRP
ncbi:MAG: hypothetical protein ACTS6J_09245 [Burkholderiales bacterium]